MSDQVDLNVRELLQNAHSTLCKRHNSKAIILPQKALAEIANDSDGHRTRVGYMGYENAELFQLDGKTWTIARGEKYSLKIGGKVAQMDYQLFKYATWNNKTKQFGMVAKITEYAEDGSGIEDML